MDDLISLKYPKKVKPPHEFKVVLHAPSAYIPKCQNIHHESLLAVKRRVHRAPDTSHIFLKEQESVPLKLRLRNDAVLSKRKIAEMIGIVDAKEKYMKEKSERQRVSSIHSNRSNSNNDNSLTRVIQEEKKSVVNNILNSEEFDSVLQEESKKEEKKAAIKELLRSQRERLYGTSFVQRERIIEHFGRSHAYSSDRIEEIEKREKKPLFGGRINHNDKRATK